MQCYYSKHECSICFVKVYLIPLVLVSQPCPAFFLKDMARTCMQNCPRCVKCTTWVRHLKWSVHAFYVYIYFWRGVIYFSKEKISSSIACASNHNLLQHPPSNIYDHVLLFFKLFFFLPPSSVSSYWLWFLLFRLASLSIPTCTGLQFQTLVQY